MTKIIKHSTHTQTDALGAPGFKVRALPLAVKMSSGLLMAGALGMSGAAFAQQDDPEFLEEILVTGQRASIQSAQEIKRNSNQILDSIVAEDIGKLPDRSIAEALQRVPGVSVSRFDQPGDPEHFAGEGAGVSIRGLPQVRAELNGREIFSASDGRALSFDDVPAELMAGVDVYKSPTADMIEGGLGGIVNLRTRMPFDQDGQLISATVKANYGDAIEEVNYEGSVLYSNNWDTSIGRFGFLVDFSDSEISSRADNLYNRAFFPRDGIDGFDQTVWVPKGADWRRNDYNRQRQGAYLAIQYSPVDSTEFYLTAFESKAERNWYENAFFTDAGGQPQPVDGANDWVLDGNDIFQSGTITGAEGVSLGTSSRLSNNESKTADYAVGVEWAEGPWTVNLDFQLVDSNATRVDYTLGTVVFPPRVRLANVLSESGPTIVDVDNALADLDNYSFGQMMHLPADNDAESKSARLDVQYDFEDSIVRSVKAGVRFSNKEANNRGFNNWSARVQPWNSCCWDGPPPTIGSSSLMQPYTFDDFQRGDADVPVDAWMFTTDAVNNFRETTDAMVAATPPPEWATWAVSQPDFDFDLNDPANSNSQEEKSQAAYVMLDLEFTEQLSGNLGVRYVTTENTAQGFLNPPDRTIGELQPWYFDPIPLSTENDYSHVLPSLNLRYDVSDEFVLRFAASKGIWKPEFPRLKNYWNLSVNDPEVDELVDAGIEDGPDDGDDVSGSDITEENFHLVPFKFNLSSNGTNPLLEPMTANQYDLSAEWYFNDDGGMLHAGIFYKDVKDFFRTNVFTTEINGINWAGDTFVNVGTAEVSGFEIGGTYYFDSLPGLFSGFGITANYTYTDSSTDIPVFIEDEELGVQGTVNAQDTDGTEITVNELEGLAKDTFNIALMYEYSAFYSRLAYNWSSGALQTIGPNGWSDNGANPPYRLPVFSDDYGQLDFSAGYNFNENLSLNFEAYNISRSKTKGTMRQNHVGEHTAFVYSQDTRYGLSLRLTF